MPLIEREAESAHLRRRLVAARHGHGSVVAVEAAPGHGTSSLLTLAGDLARAHGFRVLRAAATELERDFPFGVALQLFEPAWHAAVTDGAEHLFEGPAARSRELLSGHWFDRTPASANAPYPLIHSLFWLTRHLTVDEQGGNGPLLVVVDDAQWADSASLRFLAYLAERVSTLPAVVLLGMHDGAPGADTQALAALRRTAEGSCLRPRPLSRDGIGEAVRHVWPGAHDSFLKACAQLTGGEPFLLVKLLDEVQAQRRLPDTATAKRLHELDPAAIRRSVSGRLAALDDAARSMACALAVLGDGAALAAVAGLAGLDGEAASAAADALSAAHLLAPGMPLRFGQPLLALAVLGTVSAAERGRAHRQAAELLGASGAPADQVAAQLMRAPAESDPQAIGWLRRAAAQAREQGAPEAAVALLKRALAEHPAPDIYAELLAELGQVESAAGLPSAVDRLERAIEVTAEAPKRAALALAQSRAYLHQGRYQEAAAALAEAERQSDGADVGLQDELDAACVSLALCVPALLPEAGRRGPRLLERAGANPTPAQRRAVAHLTLQSSLQGAPREEVVELAERAWGDGALLRSGHPEERLWRLLSTALLTADELERSLDIAHAAMREARALGTATDTAIAGHARAWPLLEQGQVAEAIVEAELALGSQPEVWTRGSQLRTAYAALALCRVARDELEQAETALSIIDHPDVRDSLHVPYLLDARARVRLAQHRPDEALADALAARDACRRHAVTSPGAVPWRTTAALAHLARGETAHARQLAERELTLAREADVRRAELRAQRVLALTHRGERAIELLTEALNRGDGQPPRLERIEALIDLGGALRRANRRAAARDPLHTALELAERGGATQLAARARTELAATGARSRRVALGGVEALTPSERRVAEHAARGLTTREMAEALFVTPKTVEFHLRNIYQKLEIGSRPELTALMGELATG